MTFWRTLTRSHLCSPYYRHALLIAIADIHADAVLVFVLVYYLLYTLLVLHTSQHVLVLPGMCPAHAKCVRSSMYQVYILNVLTTVLSHCLLYDTTVVQKVKKRRR